MSEKRITKGPKPAKRGRPTKGKEEEKDGAKAKQGKNAEDEKNKTVEKWIEKVKLACRKLFTEFEQLKKIMEKGK